MRNSRALNCLRLAQRSRAGSRSRSSAAVLTSPRPPQVGHGSHSTCASDSRVRLRVISTRPSCVKPFTVSRVRSRASALLELRQHRVAMLGVLHVDEVDDDDAAEVAQPQLARDRLRRLEVGLEDRVVEAAAADEAAGVDVDRRHRLGLVDDQVAARLQVDAARRAPSRSRPRRRTGRTAAARRCSARCARRRCGVYCARELAAASGTFSRESTRMRAVSSSTMSRSTRCARFRSW